MIAQILKSSFDPFFEAPIEAWNEFANHCALVHFQKEETIKEQGRQERFFYFILKGSAGTFLWKESNFVCLDFVFDRHFCGDYMSLITKKPTPLQVMALEDSEMLRMSAADFYLMGSEAIGAVIHKLSAESAYVSKQTQQIELLTKSAGERYELLLKKFPGIQNRVPLKHIASYLGITPQSLSRIRQG